MDCQFKNAGFPVIITCLLVFNTGIRVTAQNYRVEVLQEPPPKEELSEEIVSQLSEEGFKIIRGESRTVLEFWPCKEWSISPGFTSTGERLFPFESGQLIGAFRYMRKGSDFRDQDMSRGVYTARYDLQPEDGNHLGTSPTRDFLLLVKSENDTAVERIDDEEKLSELSAEAAGSSHPAMLCLQTPDESGNPTPRIRHDEENDWWIVTFGGKANNGDEVTELLLSLVVVGYADE